MSKPPSPTDFIGVLAVLGGEIAEGSVKFANAYPIWLRLFTSFFVVPGLYKVAILLIKCNDLPVGLAFASGIREDKKKITGFKSNYKYKYVGTRSGANAPVANAAFEAWLNVHNTHKQEACTLFFRRFVNLGNPTFLSYAKITNNSQDEKVKMSLCTYKDIMRIILLAVLQIVAIAALPLMIYCFNGNKWDGIVPALVIILVNMISYFCVVFVVALDVCYTARSSPSTGVEPGNCIVTDTWGENIYAINGTEEMVQSLLQRELRMKKGGKIKHYVEFAFAIFGCATTVATVLVTPLMSTKGKVFLAIELFIGLLVSMLYSSTDNEAILSKIADEYYNITNYKYKKFTNRTAAVAAAILFTEGKSNYIGENFIPRTDEFNNVKRILSSIAEMSDYNLMELRTYLQPMIHMYINDYSFRRSEVNLNAIDNRGPDFQTEYNLYQASLNVHYIKLIEKLSEYVDMSSITSHNISFDSWPKRLAIDIVEAFVDVYVQ